MENFDKYRDTLNKYKLKVDEKKVKENIEKILNENLEKNNNPKVLKKIYSLIDLTSLNSTDSRDSIFKFVEEVNNFDGSTDLDNVAALCVYPNMVSVVKDCLTADIKIASVAGGFPSSHTFTEIKIAETAMAIASGADEIDIVMNLGLYRDGNYQELSEEISEIKETCREAKLKIIIETGALPSLTDVKQATLLALYSGADFVKTSTGKEYPGASLEACYVICETIREYTKKTGVGAGIKVSGGIRSTEDALRYYTLAESILGADTMNDETFRIGASSLAKNILESLNN